MSASPLPTPEAAWARLRAVQPAAYARTRNHLDGAVTGLSPYLTHGFLTLGEVLAVLRQSHSLPISHKLIAELGWRAWFRHAWRHEGDGIFQSLRPGPLPEHAYRREMPADVLEARTGLAVIDRAVAHLYGEGLLHNHARMWLASYLVHIRKVHWRTGADWMVSHLLDGDLASNHLSWQWVAGTGSSKPYLFNADNVARFAPAEWHVPRTVLDTDYDTLDRMARQAHLPPAGASAAPGAAEGMSQPVVSGWPPAAVDGQPMATDRFTAPLAEAVQGRDVWLMHPWCLGDPPAVRSSAGCLTIALIDTDVHARWPWSPTRWRFVLDRMQSHAGLCWAAPAAVVAQALRGARAVHGRDDPHLSPAIRGLGLVPEAPAFVVPDRPFTSFSAWWSRARLGELPAVDAVHVSS